MPNTLTPQEQATGWQLLWDGKTTTGWRSVKTEEFPTKGWAIHDGVLTVQEIGGAESASGGDSVGRLLRRAAISFFDMIANLQKKHL